MATALETTPCFTCKKVKSTVRCEGCSKPFCLNDFEDHRKELSTQLDEVEVARDVFQQALIDTKNSSRKNEIIEQIDQWENQSISKIQQAAQEARHIILEHTALLNAEMAAKLDKLTNQIRQSREEKDFFETDVQRWKEKLTQMQAELMKPPGVVVRTDPLPFISKIRIDLVDQLNQPNNHDIADMIPCELCHEPINLSVFNEHTKTCVDRHNQQIQNLLQRPVVPIPVDLFSCKYCHQKCTVYNFLLHEKSCKKNPINMILARQSRA